jgi:hypothetical protein
LGGKVSCGTGPRVVRLTAAGKLTAPKGATVAWSVPVQTVSVPRFIILQATPLIYVLQPVKTDITPKLI